MKRNKTPNEERENYHLSKSGCIIAAIGFLLSATLILSGCGFFNTVFQWFKKVTDPAPEGREAVIWRYFKGLETGEYEHWETGYDTEGNFRKHSGILWDMDESWAEEKLRDSHRYYKRKYGDDFTITYEVDDVESMDDEQLIRFSEYLEEQYDMYGLNRITVTDENGREFVHPVVTDKAWIYELYIEIEGEDDDTSYKSNYVVYEIDGQLFLEPMDFE